MFQLVQGFEGLIRAHKMFHEELRCTTGTVFSNSDGLLIK